MGAYWTHNGTYEVLLRKLHDLINEKLDEGTMHFGENYHLEQLRLAKNAYYRLFNDGDLERDQERFFDVIGRFHDYGTEGMFKKTEPAMDLMILRAGVEQKLI